MTSCCWLCDSVIEPGETCPCGELPIVDARETDRVPRFAVATEATA